MASLIRYPDSRYWVAAFRDSCGRQIRRSTREVDKKRAQRAAEILERAAKRQGNLQTLRQAFAGFVHEQFGEELRNSTVRAYALGWLAARRPEVSHSSYARYQKIIGKFLSFLGAQADRDLSEIKKTRIAEFRNAQAETLSTATARLELKVVKMLFRQARLEGYLLVDPAEGIAPLKDRSGHDKPQRRPFTIAELQAILECASSEWQSLIQFGLYTGQRLGDLATLRWNQIDLERRQIRFVTRKTGKSLLVPIAAPLARQLEGVAASSDDPRAPVHPQAFGLVQAQQGRVVSLSNQFGEILVAAGLVKPRQQGRSHTGRGIGRDAKREGAELSFHSLRHTAVSLLKDAGIPDAVVMALVGHGSAAMSARYTHVGKEALENAASKMPDLTARQPRAVLALGNGDSMKQNQNSMNEFPGLRFRFASTMKHIPHFYVVRSPENEAEYLQLANRIAEEGILEVWQKDGRTYRYLYLGAWKYWCIHPVINRARVNAQYRAVKEA